VSMSGEKEEPPRHVILADSGGSIEFGGTVAATVHAPLEIENSRRVSTGISIGNTRRISDDQLSSTEITCMGSSFCGVVVAVFVGSKRPFLCLFSRA